MFADSMPARVRLGDLAILLMVGCYSAATDPGAGLPGDIASIRIVNENGIDRTSHLPLFPGIPETLTVHPYRADGSQITVIEGGATSSFVFSPTNLATVQAVSDSLTKVVSAAVPPGASGAYYVTLQFPFESVPKTFGPFDVLIH